MKKTKNGIPRREVSWCGNALVKTHVVWAFASQIAKAEHIQREMLLNVERTMGADSCLVYVLTNTCGSVKIGHARNLSARLRTLQCGSYTPILVAAVVEVSLMNRTESRLLARDIEQRAHDELGLYRGMGEWFLCAFEFCESAMRHALQESSQNCEQACAAWAWMTGNAEPCADIGEMRTFADAVKCHESYQLRKAQKA